MTKSTKLGMCQRRLERIRPVMEKHVGDDKLRGLVTLLYRHGEVVHQTAIGSMDRERGVEMREDAIFRIYSMTKPITCVALMMLYEQGCFQLTDPVSKFIPAFAKLKVLVETPGDAKLVDPDRDVTVHDLLTHLSGMTYHFREQGAVERMYREAEVSTTHTLEEFVNTLATMPLAFQPGSEWRYSFSQDVAAHLVQVLSGQSFDDFLNSNVFHPLGMVDTGFFVPPEKRDRFAAMYGVRDVINQDATSAMLHSQAKAGVNVLIGDPRACLEASDHNVLRGGHGLVSTAQDYLQFCRMMLGNGQLEGHRCLSRKTVELMCCNHIPEALMPIGFEDGPTPGVGYGLGFGVVMDVGLSQTIGSPGTYYWSGAATTSFWVDPREALIGIQMAQFQPSGFHLVAEDFKVMAYQAIGD